MKRKIEIADQEKEVTILRQGERIRVTLDGVTRELVVLQRDGALAVVAYEDDQGRRQVLRLAGSAAGERRILWVNGRLSSYALVGRQAARAAAAQGALSADIPAVVSEIVVAVGDGVEAGQPLLLLESMKMVIPIKAPFAGTVTGLHCAPGEAVQPGVELVSLTPAASPSE